MSHAVKLIAHICESKKHFITKYPPRAQSRRNQRLVIGWGTQKQFPKKFMNFLFLLITQDKLGPRTVKYTYSFIYVGYNTVYIVDRTYFGPLPGRQMIALNS